MSKDNFIESHRKVKLVDIFIRKLVKKINTVIIETTEKCIIEYNKSMHNGMCYKVCGYYAW